MAEEEREHLLGSNVNNNNNTASRGAIQSKHDKPSTVRPTIHTQTHRHVHAHYQSFGGASPRHAFDSEGERETEREAEREREGERERVVESEYADPTLSFADIASESASSLLPSRSSLFLRSRELYEQCMQFHREDDLVTLGVRHFLVLMLCVSLLWLLSFVLVMLQVLFEGAFFAHNWPLFLPMWAGSLVGLYSCFAVAFNLCASSPVVLSRERRLFLRAQGIEDAQSFIDSESLPLLRRLFFWKIVAVLSLVLLMIAQVLFYLYFAEEIELWHATVPVNILLFFFLFYLYLVNAVSLKSCLLFSLVAVQWTLFISREEAALQNVPWLFLASPILFVGCFLFYTTIHTWTESARGLIVLRTYQRWALRGFAVSIAVGELAAILAVGNDYFPSVILSKGALVLWMVAVPVFALSALAVLFVQGLEVARTRGFRAPKVLSRTQRGWELLANESERTEWLVGTVRVKPLTPQEIALISSV